MCLKVDRILLFADISWCCHLSRRQMPPKKGGDGVKSHPIIGRFGTSLKIGIVGLPNVGKSTFFNVLTKSQAAAENFPFCTIDPNESRVPVPDDRFDFLCQYHKPPSKIPAFLNVVDIAGLVKGAHTGQGLGNSFLSHINACDGIFHLMQVPLAAGPRERRRGQQQRSAHEAGLAPPRSGAPHAAAQRLCLWR
ncbi:obg-like ATPase 1 [Nothoprocta perdicaria]|uniref:obg-like ATPase 1 n=1 Tax=Nothoprocta perdicaria TaxID=30464 RepID=UPI000E1BAE3A|nr:obg-like ATPase 1 [Nothoprocta perdicaria]